MGEDKAKVVDGKAKPVGRRDFLNFGAKVIAFAGVYELVSLFAERQADGCLCCPCEGGCDGFCDPACSPCNCCEPACDPALDYCDPALDGLGARMDPPAEGTRQPELGGTLNVAPGACDTNELS